MKPHRQGNWWNTCAIKTSVILADFCKQIESYRQAGNNPTKFVYPADERLRLLREYKSANI